MPQANPRMCDTSLRESLKEQMPEVCPGELQFSSFTRTEEKKICSRHQTQPEE